MTVIAIDAMGGDFAPDEIVKGVVAASREFDVRYILAGSRERIEILLAAYKTTPSEAGIVEILNTDTIIGMDEEPSAALSAKPDASIVRAAESVAQGKADALVSAGNTGAVILAAAKNIPLIPGIERSAFAAYYPTARFDPLRAGTALLLDVGATLHCEPKHLVHFAVMGHVYSTYITGINSPRIGLLNVGTEPEKGGKTLVSTHSILRTIKELNFIGNIEGFDIIKGKADVIVCEGMLGNIVIKLSEGITETILALGKFAYKRTFAYRVALSILYPGIKKLKKHTDYSEHGGASLLGFSKPIIKAHGRSASHAIKNAIGVAAKTVDFTINDKIADMIQSVNQTVQWKQPE